MTDSSDRLPLDAFIAKARDFSEWRWHAESHWDGSQVLRAKWEERRRSRSMGEPGALEADRYDLIAPTLLLAAHALECAFKGVIVANDPNVP